MYKITALTDRTSSPDNNVVVHAARCKSHYYVRTRRRSLLLPTNHILEVMHSDPDDNLNEVIIVSLLLCGSTLDFKIDAEKYLNEETQKYELYPISERKVGIFYTNDYDIEAFKHKVDLMCVDKELHGEYRLIEIPLVQSDEDFIEVYKETMHDTYLWADTVVYLDCDRMLKNMAGRYNDYSYKGFLMRANRVLLRSKGDDKFILFHSDSFKSNNHDNYSYTDKLWRSHRFEKYGIHAFVSNRHHFCPFKIVDGIPVRLDAGELTKAYLEEVFEKVFAEITDDQKITVYEIIGILMEKPYSMTSPKKNLLKAAELGIIELIHEKRKHKIDNDIVKYIPYKERCLQI